MNTCQFPYVQLWESIHEVRGRSLLLDVLLPWSAQATQQKEFLCRVAECQDSNPPPMSGDDRTELYALSRVNETLLLAFQSGRADGTDWLGPKLPVDEYVEFMLSLGFNVVERESFSPLFHEVVEVSQSPRPDVPISTVGTFWPCCMLGNLVFSRAGACVEGGNAHIDKRIAETSTLYWANRRQNRPFHDLSHGWGSNSQWRTPFRRDYTLGNVACYNLDGKTPLHEDALGDLDHNGLTYAEQIELVRHRCFVTVAKPHDDLFPYDYSYCEVIG